MHTRGTRLKEVSFCSLGCVRLAGQPETADESPLNLESSRTAVQQVALRDHRRFRLDSDVGNAHVFFAIELFQAPHRWKSFPSSYSPPQGSGPSPIRGAPALILITSTGFEALGTSAHELQIFAALPLSELLPG